MKISEKQTACLLSKPHIYFNPLLGKWTFRAYCGPNSHLYNFPALRLCHRLNGKAEPKT